MALSHRSAGVGGETSSSGPSSHQTSADLPQLPVSLGSTLPRVSSRSQQQVPVSSGMVEGSAEHNQRSTSRSVLSRSHSVHGRIPDELGSSRRQSPLLRRLVTTRSSAIDQPTGTPGSHSNHPGSTSIMEEPETHDRLRQLHNHLVHQQDGWNAEHPPTRTDPSTIPSGSVSVSHVASQTHSRSPQQTGRHTIENSSSGRHRVDAVDANLSTSPIPMGISLDRPDGNSDDNSTSSLRVTLSRPESIRHRRNIIRLDRTGRLHLSSVADDSNRTTETQTQSMCSDGHHSVLAESTLVSGSPRPAGRISKKTPSTSRSAIHATQQTSSRKRGSSFSARMQTIIDSSLDQGFSTEVSQRIARGRHVNSTQVIYDSKWLKFENWCDRRKISPSLASLGNLADFLLHLFNELKLSYSTITGYRSSINSVWRALGRVDVESHAIHQLLDSFKVDRPRSRVVIPKWDLALVLRVLTQPPYEPLDEIDFKNLSAKTVFLLLLATSRRRGDIHAIDPKRVIFKSNYAILETLPGYIPKVRANAEREARYRPMVVRSLSAVTSDDAELTLCPVRALRAYEKVASERVSDRPQFFISTRAKGRSVTKNTISAWVVKLLRSAYSSASSEDCRLAQTSVHEVRAIATSLAFQATYALDDILSAASWANPTTFTDHYLRDVAGLQGRLHVLAPCVVAGKTLT